MFSLASSKIMIIDGRFVLCVQKTHIYFINLWIIQTKRGAYNSFFRQFLRLISHTLHDQLQFDVLKNIF
jgi:hypothetical protein